MILTTAALCLALNVYHEARGETVPGQYAVALVTMNRAGGASDKVCQVVKAEKQFSWTTKMVSGNRLLKFAQPTDSEAWERAQIVANVTLSGRMSDFTHGSLFYHAKSVRPAWRHSMVQTKQVGRHIFYRHA